MTYSYDDASSGVRDVWVSVNGGDYITHEGRDGDVWTFPLTDPTLTGHITVEAWAEDNAGNQAYRAVILYLVEGTIKSVRWLTTGGECVMMRIQRPSVGMAERPSCVMMPHECRRGQYAAVL